MRVQPDIWCYDGVLILCVTESMNIHNEMQE
jgi:hypothetical protein